MWRIDNRTPFAADRTWFRDGDGTEVWAVAVKATYDILPDGTTKLAAEQVPVDLGPSPRAGFQSLRCESDLGPAKSATDVIVNGHAWAPHGKPVAALTVGFQVGAMTRMARVHGERYWQPVKSFRWFRSARRAWIPSEAEPFVTMPLVYERAFGGSAKDDDIDGIGGNPLGRGVAEDGDGRVWLANIEPVDRRIIRRGEEAPAIGFGAIPVHWHPRRQYAGTYDAAWRESRYPLPPEDLDPRFWQIAPPEQQIAGRLKGGETVMLLNMTRPDFLVGGRLAFRLPKATLLCETLFHDGTREYTRPVIHSVILEPSEPRVSIVHHMALPCHAKVNLLERTRITQKRRPLDRADVPAFGGPLAAISGVVERNA